MAISSNLTMDLDGSLPSNSYFVELSCHRSDQPSSLVPGHSELEERSEYDDDFDCYGGSNPTQVDTSSFLHIWTNITNFKRSTKSYRYSGRDIVPSPPPPPPPPLTNSFILDMKPSNFEARAATAIAISNTSSSKPSDRISAKKTGPFPFLKKNR